MPLAGFEPTIPVFKGAKTFHALDCAATVTGIIYRQPSKIIFRSTYVYIDLLFKIKQNNVRLLD
jgi:hypothetical protein